MCKQSKLELAGQKKKFSLREAVDPEATTDIRALFYTPIHIQDGWCFGVETIFFVSVKINKKGVKLWTKHGWSAWKRQLILFFRQTAIRAQNLR